MKKAIFPVMMIAVFMLSACNLPFSIVWNTPPTATAAPIVEATAAPVVETTVAPTDAPAFTGLEKNMGGVYMVIPECLATGATGEIIAEQNPGPDMPYFAYNPAYRKITLTGYPLSGKFWQPEISVYPVAEFEALIPDNYINNEVTNLQQILSSQVLPGNGDYPFLPLENAAQVFKAQAGIINFQNGSGLGYLTEMAQFYDPANNHDMFYTYQGITSDAKYWITITLPVNAPFLQASYDDPAVPADGIVMPLDPSDTAAMQNYNSAITAKLNSTPLDTFTPSLACVNTFIQSFSIGD
jgi:hypothetical protein